MFELLAGEGGSSLLRQVTAPGCWRGGLIYSGERARPTQLRPLLRNRPETIEEVFFEKLGMYVQKKDQDLLGRPQKSHIVFARVWKARRTLITCGWICLMHRQQPGSNDYDDASCDTNL